MPTDREKDSMYYNTDTDNLLQLLARALPFLQGRTTEDDKEALIKEILSVVEGEGDDPSDVNKLVEQRYREWKEGK